MIVLIMLARFYFQNVFLQYYTEHGGHRFVDLGLQCHRMKCQVHKDFKLVYIIYLDSFVQL